jgi:hypothetical protein
MRILCLFVDWHSGGNVWGLGSGLSGGLAGLSGWLAGLGVLAGLGEVIIGG